MKKRILSLLLVCVMLLSLLPTAALAYADDTVAVIDDTEYTSLSTALSSAAANQTVMVVKDTTVTSGVQAKKDCTVKIEDGVTVTLGTNGKFNYYDGTNVHFSGNGTIKSGNNQSPFIFNGGGISTYFMEAGKYVGADYVFEITANGTVNVLISGGYYSFNESLGKSPDQYKVLNLYISGGYFTKDVSDWCIGTHKCVELTNTDPAYDLGYRYTVAPVTAEDDPAAKIGDTYYLTLKAALASVESGETVTLLADYNGSVAYKEDNKDFTLDLNGYSICNTGIALSVEHKTTNGTVNITVTDSSSAGTGSIESKNGVAIQLSMGCSVTVQDGVTLKGTYAVKTKSTYLVSVNLEDATVTTTTGIFDLSNNGTASIAAGVYNFDPTAYVDKNVSTIAQNDNGTWTVAIPTPVAQIGTGDEAETFTSLAEAVAAVPTNGTKTTVTLLADIEADLGDSNIPYVTINGGRNVDLNMNGHKIEVSSASAGPFAVNGGTLELSGTGTVANTYTTNNYGFYVVKLFNESEEVEDYSVFTQGENVTLNSVYYGINVTGTKNYGTVVNLNGECNAVKTGVYVSGNIHNDEYAPIINIGATAKINAQTTQPCMYIAGNAIVNIADGTEFTAAQNCFEIAAGELNINGGTFTGGNTIGELAGIGGGIDSDTCCAVFVSQHGTNLPLTVNVEGGEFTAAVPFAQATGKAGGGAEPEKVNLNISGGKFLSTATENQTAVRSADKTGFITGGLFSERVDAALIAPDYACVGNTDSVTKTAYPYVVKAVTTEVAEVKAEEGKIVVDETPVTVEVKPATQEAPAALTNEQVAEVAQEINTIITNPEVATFEDTKIDEATKDLTTQTVQVDGFNISGILNLVKTKAAETYATSATKDNEIGVTVGSGAQQTFTTEDVTTKITVDLTSTKVETTTETAGTQVVSATVSTMTFDVKPVATITVDKGNGETEVVKAVIDNNDIKAPITFRLPVKDGWGEVRVSHNGIYKGTYIAQGEEGNRYVELASKEFSYWTVENNEFEDPDAVAKTGNRYYDSLAEALKDAVNGDTVEVLQNTSINDELFIANKSITLDLGGFTVDVTAPTGKTIPIHIGTKDSSTAAAGLTVKNGTINGTASSNVFGVYGMTTDGSAKRSLTLDGVTMNVTGGYAVALNNNGTTNNYHGYGAEIVIKNSTLKAPYVISVNGSIQDTTGNFPKVKIENSTLKANDTELAIYAAGYAAWDIDGSNITGGTGIYAKAGTFDIDGGKIEGNGAYADPEPEGNGATSTGDAIIMDSKTGYAGHMTMDLKNVTVTSVNGYAIQEALTDANSTFTESIAIDDGSYTSAAGKAAVATSETFDRAETTTLTVAGTPTGVTAQTDLGKFTSFNVNYGDGISYGNFSSFLNVAGPVTISDKVNFATMKAGQQLNANFDVTMGTVSYKTGSMTEFKTIHSGDALDGVANDTAITFQIECGSGVTNTFTFTPHWASVEIPYNLAVKPISGDTVTLTVGTDDAPNYVEYGVYASVPNGTTAMAIGSYDFELNYDTTAFDFANFTAADSAATVQVNSTTAGKADVGVTLNTAVTPEVAGNDGSLTYSALLGTLKLKVKSDTTATTGVLTTSITNTTGGKPVVTPKGYDDNKGVITTKDHTQYLISFEYVGATGEASGWILAGETPTMPTATPNDGWSLATDASGEGWNPATPVAATAPATYTYTAHHDQYTVTWDNTNNPMTVLKGDTAISSGDKMYYEDTLNITVAGLTGNTVIRNGDFKYQLGEAPATGVSREGDTGFTYKVGPNVVNANVVLSYTTSEYVTVTFDGGDAVDLIKFKAPVTGDDLKAIALKSATVADKLYASVNDFIKGNEGTTYSIPDQVPKANARLVPPDAKTDATKQQWKIGTTTDTVANSVLTAATSSQVFTADTTLTADAVMTYAVTFAAGSNGSIKTTEPAQVTTYNVDAGTTIANILAGSAKDYTNGTADGTPVVLPQTTPANGYKFKNWTAPEGVTAVNAATTITGNFEVAKYSIGVSENAAFKNLTGADATGKISMENDVTFKLMLKKNTRIESVSYTVASNANDTAFGGLENQALTANENGVYTIPKANILGDVTVTVVTKDTVKITVKSGNTDKGTVGGTTAFVVDKGSNVSAWDYTALTTTAEPGYEVEKNEGGKIIFYTNENCETAFSDETFTAEATLYVKFVDAKYVIELDELVNTTGTTGITSKTVGETTTYYVTHGTDAKFKLAKDANVPQIITSVTYSVEGGVQNVLLQPVNGDYTIPGDRIIGKVTVTVKTLADEVFGSETATNKISALFILRDSTMTGVEGSGAYMANVVQNGDMKILALVSEAFKATDYAGTSKFFQLADGTQLYWSDRYDAYVCWVDKNMTSADLDGFVKFDGTKTATEIINGGDINFDNAVDSADAGIVNDALHGTRQVPTSALQLFEMDVANTSGKSYVNGATIDANDVTWILKNTVGLTAAKVSNPIWAKPE